MSYDPKNRTTLRDTTPFFSAYSEKIDQGMEFPENSPHTRQEFKEESDINTIMASYLRTGEMPHVNEMAPQFLDVTDMDFHAHMNVIREAQELFEALPSEMRHRFQNDPGVFVDFTSDPINRPEMARMGLLSPEATQAVLTPQPQTKNAPESVTSVPPAPQQADSSSA